MNQGDNSYDRLFRQLPPAIVPAGLSKQILAAVSERQLRLARIKLVTFGTLSLSSFASFFFLVRSLFQSMAASGLGEYLSLVWSDGSVLLSSWHEFALLLAETLPVLGLAMVASLLLLGIWSLGQVLRDARPALRLA